MERYSAFRDPFTGINPFINPKRRIIRFTSFLKIFYRLPIFILTYLFPKTISFLIKIKQDKIIRKGGVYICNRSSIFDFQILKYIFENPKLFNVTEDGYFKEIHNGLKKKRLDKRDVNVVFIEECSSNNTCLMKFVANYNIIQCDYVIGLSYSESCIYMYGNYLKYVFYFLGSKNSVDVKILETNRHNDLLKVLKLTQSSFGLKEKKEFLSLVNNQL